MKNRLALLAISAAFVLSLVYLLIGVDKAFFRKLDKPDTRWLGRLAYGGFVPAQKYPPDQHVVNEKGERQLESQPGWSIVLSGEVEIGLRPDGTVVWREKQP